MTDEVTVIHGDCLDRLREIPDSAVDAVIVDPPYSSGGLMRGDRTASTNSKYVRSSAVGLRGDFDGDTRDGRSWLYWCALWIKECLRVVKPGGYFLMFSDWRQVPTASDAIQCGGFVWRGLIAWDKGRGARAAHKGLFRHQCEYVVWGTSGVSKVAEWGGPWDGCYHVPVLQDDKHHVTGKPTKLLMKLVECCPPGGVVLDCFAGSGTTGVACKRMGRRCILIEENARYIDVIRRRLAAAETPLFHGLSADLD